MTSTSEWSARERTVVEMLRRQVAARDATIRELRLQLDAIAQALNDAAGVQVARVHLMEPDATLVHIEDEHIEGLAEDERVVMIGDIPGVLVVGMDGSIRLTDEEAAIPAARRFWQAVLNEDPKKLRARIRQLEREAARRDE